MEVKVLVELKAKNIDQTFTYHVPFSMQDKISIGIRVLVPFAKRKLEAFVLEVGDFKENYKLKDIISVVDEFPVLTNELIELGKYMSKKTLASLISCYQTMLPKALKASYKTNINKKYNTYFKLIDYNYVAKNITQQKIIDKLKNAPCLKKEIISISSTVYKTLLKNNVIEEIKEEVYRLNETTKKEDNIRKLTVDQKNVVDSIFKSLDCFTPFLLHGVTGSGKTEVYMHIISEVIKYDKEVIVLVPEISLTPQMVDNFKKRFGSTVAIYHSALNDGERYDEYRKIKNGDAKIVVGARSAIFSPFENLGLIIVDEEHTETYKQDNNPRYDAIDIALKRAKYNNIPIVLGSATPDITSYTRAKMGVYKLLELKSRINKTLPKVELVDMKGEIRRGNRVISEKLKNEINNCIQKEEQVILFLNRRGYFTTVMCSNCGHVLKCPNCDIPLTYHKNQNKMTCHYCDYTTYKVYNCPKCTGTKFSNLGMGTEKLQEEIESMFNVKTLRMDIDTTSKKGSHAKIIESFRNKEASILIGTQMVSKGLDFDNVTLVGVINGDATLNIPDYRSAERTFALLNQVAGRSGRSKLPGKVIIQGFNLDHYSIEYASKNDYISFYNEEMNIRKRLNYPPYVDITLIKVTGYDYELCYNEAYKIKNYLERKKITVLGPSNSYSLKINNKYHIQVIIKYKHLKDVYESLKDILNMYTTKSKVNVEIDINPKKI